MDLRGYLARNRISRPVSTRAAFFVAVTVLWQMINALPYWWPLFNPMYMFPGASVIFYAAVLTLPQVIYPLRYSFKVFAAWGILIGFLAPLLWWQFLGYGAVAIPFIVMIAVLTTTIGTTILNVMDKYPRWATICVLILLLLPFLLNMSTLLCMYYSSSSYYACR